MSLEPPIDDGVDVFLHGSGATDQHRFSLYPIPQGSGTVKAIPIILNVGNKVATRSFRNGGKT